MAEATPLLEDVTDRQFETQTEGQAYFRRPIRFLTIATLVLCAVTIPLLIADFIIIKRALFGGGYSSGYFVYIAQQTCKEFGISILVALLFSTINFVLVDFPILLNIIADIVIISLTIPRLVHYIEQLPNFDWCQIQPRYPQYPGDPGGEVPPHPKCAYWKSVAMSLSIISAVFGGMICVIYILLLLLRTVKIAKDKRWKRPLPTISLDISLRIIGREGNGSGQRQIGDGVPSGLGPLHL